MEKRINLVKLAHGLGEAGERKVASSCVVHVYSSFLTTGEGAWKSHGAAGIDEPRAGFSGVSQGRGDLWHVDVFRRNLY